MIEWTERFGGRSYVGKSEIGVHIQIVMQSIDAGGGTYQDLGWVLCVGGIRREYTGQHNLCVAKHRAVLLYRDVLAAELNRVGGPT